MDVDLKQFWNRLVASDILDELICSQLRTQFESESAGNESDSANLANWLCKRKAISRFQADILLGSHAGRLKYGNYLVSEPLDTGSLRFAGRHKLTRHPVLLTFVDGDDSQALAAWNRAKSVSDRLAKSSHPNVLQVHEWVAISEYRFVVSEFPAGVRLAERVPPKSRVSHHQAINIIRQLAKALQYLDKVGAPASQLSEEQVWHSKSGMVQLEPSLDADHPSGSNGDDVASAFQLGQIWYRMLSGRLPKFVEATNTPPQVPKSELARLKKYEVPVESIQLIWKLLGNAKKQPSVYEKIIKHCDSQFTNDDADPRVPKTWKPYAEWLERVPAISDAPSLIDGDIKLEGEQVESAQPIRNVQFGSEDGKLVTTDSKGRSSTRSTYAMIGSLVSVACLVGLIALLTNRIPNQLVDQTDVADVNVAVPEDSNSKPDEPTAPTADSETSNTGSMQQLIDDDGHSLWETPTEGLPLDFSSVPIAPKIAISIRRADLDSVDGERLLLRAFGTSLNDQLTELEQQLGVQSEEIEQLLITFHSNEDLTYDAFAKVTLREPQPKQNLKDRWQDLVEIEHEDSSYYQQDDRHCFVFTGAENDFVSQFAMGAEWLVKESMESGGNDLTTGAMRRMVRTSDRNRHINAIILRSGLFNDEGFKLMGPSLETFNRQLSLTIDERMRAISASVHLDEGTFAELRFDSTADLPSTELQENLNGVIGSLESYADLFAARLSDQPFWNQVRDRMLMFGTDLSRNTRCGIENRQVICNGWYATPAAHNWIASTELLLKFGKSPENENEEAASRKIPANLDELLAAPRDLAVNTSPDLIVLLNNLQEEILSDYGRLPFKFEIRLMGNDLSKEGITQNQRPADFVMRKRSLADILTEIMVKANPDKNITGPDDVDCKMVWVVAPDPQNNENEVILITTRAAAETNSYQLPAAFIAK